MTEWTSGLIAETFFFSYVCMYVCVCVSFCISVDWKSLLHFLPKGILIKLFVLMVWSEINSDIMQFHLMNFISIINYISQCHSTPFPYTQMANDIVLSLSFLAKRQTHLTSIHFCARCHCMRKRVINGTKKKRKRRHSDLSWKYYFSRIIWVLFTVSLLFVVVAFSRLTLSCGDFCSMDFIALISRPKIVQTKET